MKSVYLASPLGFAESTKPFMAELVEALEGFLVVENPWSSETVSAAERAEAEAIANRHDHAAAIHDLNHRIAAGNEASIRRCDLLVAVLDGVDVDSGTASEIGFAFGLGKPCWGVRTDFRLAGDNVGAIVNLQVQYWIEAGGGTVATTIEDLVTALRPTV